MLTSLYPDVQYMEGLLPKLYGADAVEIPGARALLEDLVARNAPWAIVTSGTVPLVTGVCSFFFPLLTPDVLGLCGFLTKSSKLTISLKWLTALTLPYPTHLITAESVTNGKPDPACYLLGRERLSLSSPEKQVLVLEDSPAGIRAGKAAGCKVLAVVTSHTIEQVLAAEPDWVVRDLRSLKVEEVDGGKVKVVIEGALVRP